jgi:hypothetical protein
MRFHNHTVGIEWANSILRYHITQIGDLTCSIIEKVMQSLTKPFTSILNESDTLSFTSLFLNRKGRSSMAGRRKNRVAAFYISVRKGSERKFFRINQKGRIVIEDAGFSRPVPEPLPEIGATDVVNDAKGLFGPFLWEDFEREPDWITFGREGRNEIE